MKTQRKQSVPRSERGAAMLAALCLAMVFAISLSSYIALCYVSLMMSTRSIMSSHSIELAETGIEQALYSQNNSDWTGWTVSVAGPNSVMSTQMAMTSSGLLPTSGSPTPLNFGNGATGLVNITVTLSGGVLTGITSQGQMSLPNGTATSGGSVATVSRTLSYTAPTFPFAATPNTAVFVNAVAATSSCVQFLAAGTVDSYNSYNATSLSYQLYSAAVAGWSAVILSQDVTSGTTTVRLNDAVVDGYAVGYDYNSPSSTNWLSYGGTGQLIGKTTPPTTYIDSSRILSSPVPYQPVLAANSAAWNQYLPLSACNGDNVLANSASLGSATAPYAVYNASGINLTSGIVTITGPTVIIVSSTVRITGSAQINLLPGASLAIFADGGNVLIDCNGSGGITNGSPVPLAKNFALLSTKNSAMNYSVIINQQVPFYGVVYFPYRNIVVATTGPTAPIYGSIVGESVTFVGSPTIHYDVALRKPDSTVGDVAFDYFSSVPINVGNLVASTP